MKLLTPLLALISLSSIQALAAPLAIKCPDRIAVEEVMKETYPSWEVSADKGKVDVHLQSMLLYDGHPREMASLVPYRYTQLSHSPRALTVTRWPHP
jgi:hypothetical protein